MEVLGTLMVASLAGRGPWGAFPPVEFGLRIGRGFGGMSKDEHRRDGGDQAEIKAEFGQGGVVAYCCFHRQVSFKDLKGCTRVFRTLVHIIVS